MYELEAELAQAQAMIDVLTTRISAIPEADRAHFDGELQPLRARWRDARWSYDEAKAKGGEVRRQYERQSRDALGEVQDGLLRLIGEMNRHYAGHPPPR